MSAASPSRPVLPVRAVPRRATRIGYGAAFRTTLHDIPTVGRERVLAELMDAVKATASSAIALYVLTGEPGVGKTRVLQELLRRARVLDRHVLYGRAQEYDGPIAFAVLKDALASLTTQQLSPQAQAQLDAVVEAANRAVTDDGPRPHGLQSPLVLTTQLLRTLSEARPCVVVIDDAHLADSESLAALSLAMRHLRNQPILLAFAVRSGQWRPGTPFAATVGRLIDDGAGTLVEIEALDIDDTKALVGTALDGRPADPLTQYIYAQSGGNPLFARETLLSLIAQGSIRCEQGRYFLTGEPVPGIVSQRGALVHRVFQQDENGRRLARVMSAFKSVHLDQLPLLAQLIDLSQAELQRAFDELTDSAILTGVADGGFEFVHPLMAEVLYEDLGPAERRRVHAAAARYLSAHPDRRIGVLERATHAVEAAAPGDLDAINAALDAARLTRDTAPLSSARWYERVLGLLDPGSPQVGTILARQARAYWKGSRPDLAVSKGVEAVEHLGPGEIRTATAITVVNAAYASGRLTDAVNLSLRFADDAHEQGTLPAQRSLILTHLGRTDEARALNDRAWEQLSSSGPAEQVIGFSYLAMAEVMIGTEGRTRRALDALHRLAVEETTLPAGARLSAIESWAYVLSLMDEAVDPQELARSTADLSEQVGWHDLGGQAVTTLAHTQYLRGEWDATLDTVHSGAIALEFAGLDNNLAWLRMVEVSVLLGRGLHAAAQEILDNVVQHEDWSYGHAMRAIQQARIDFASGKDGESVDDLNALLVATADTGWHELVRQALDALIDICLDRDSRAPLLDQQDLIRSLGRGERPGKVRRAAATAVALLDADVVAVRALLTRARADANPLASGRSHLLLVVLGEDVRTHLHQAAADFEVLGARAWTRRDGALARHRGVPVDRPRPSSAGDPTSLADTDMQLLQLVRDGLNNRQIAEVMHYSRKTIEAYLSRLYRRTGSSSRISLVVTAQRNGWLAAPPPQE